MRQNKLKIIMIVYLVIIMFTGKIMAAGPPDMILLIMDQTGFAELSNYRTVNINKLQNIGAFGLMNIRTAGGLKPESTYLTAGNGKKCKGSKHAHQAVNNGKGVINNYISDLKKINKSSTYRPFIGLLGKVCRKNNKKIAVFGNTDTKLLKGRTIVSLAMDENGYVDMGNVSKQILKTNDKIWGYQTDWSKIKKCLNKIYTEADLIIIDTGDTSRIEKYHYLFTERETIAYKAKAIKRIDKFLDYLLKKVDFDKTLLGITVLTPSADNIQKGNKLTWTLLAGPDVQHGWLTSKSTRRKGIITITDLLPTIFSSLNLKENSTEDLTGHPIYSIKENTAWKDLFELNRKITTISNLRTPFIQGFIGLQIFVIILAIICIFYKSLYSADIIQYFIKYSLLTLFLVPINFLFLSLFNFHNSLNYLLLIIIISVLEIYIIVKSGLNHLQRLLLIPTLLVCIIFIDILNNNYLMADSLLGYSSIIGARYYGLGNEYMGLFIGAAIISLTGFFELLKVEYRSIYYRILSAFILFIIVYFIGAPHLGANFGGTITAAIVCIVTWLYLWGYRFNRKIFLLSIFIVILVLMGIIYLDYNQVITSRTHIGRAIEPVISGNYQELISIVKRKLAMNLKLMKWTIWTRVLLAFLVYIIILFKHPVGKLKRLLNKFPRLTAGFYGGIIGSIITLGVNDSGVVASATLLFYPMLTLLYLFNHLDKEVNNYYGEW